MFLQEKNRLHFTCNNIKCNKWNHFFIVCSVYIYSTLIFIVYYLEDVILLN